MIVSQRAPAAVFTISTMANFASSLADEWFAPKAPKFVCFGFVKRRLQFFPFLPLLCRFCLQFSSWGGIRATMFGFGARCVCTDVGRSLLQSPQLLPRSFSTSSPLLELQKRSRVRIVDNSAIGQQAQAAGKPAMVIHVYKKSGSIRKRRVLGTIGDKVMVAVMGQKKRGYIVGVVKAQDDQVPSFDTNNVVLIDDNGAPLGTRIRVPIPMLLRSVEGDISKILSIATKFV